RQLDGVGPPGPRLALDGGAAGEAQAEQAGDLVERLAGRVVEGGAEQFEVQGVVAVVERGVPPAHDQAHAGEDVLSGGQAAGVDVALDVVDAEQGDRKSGGEGKGVTLESGR